MNLMRTPPAQTGNQQVNPLPLPPIPSEPSQDCAETVAITYEEMGLLVTDKETNWFDPGKF